MTGRPAPEGSAGAPKGSTQRRSPQAGPGRDVERYFLLAMKLIALATEADRRGDVQEVRRRVAETELVVQQMGDGRDARRLKARIHRQVRNELVKKRGPASDVARGPNLGNQRGRPVTKRSGRRILSPRKQTKVPRCRVCGIPDPTLPKSAKQRVCVPCQRERRGTPVLQAGSPGLGRNAR